MTHDEAVDLLIDLGFTPGVDSTIGVPEPQRGEIKRACRVIRGRNLAATVTETVLAEDPSLGPRVPSWAEVQSVVGPVTVEE